MEQKELNIVKDISTKLWKSFDILRNYGVEYRNYYGVLLLLVIYREKINFLIKTADDQNSKYTATSIDLPSVDNEFEKLHQINRIFQETFNYWPTQVFKEVSQIIKSLKFEVLDENFPVIFDDLLYKISNAEGRTGGVNILPIEISKFISEIVDLPENAKVYNPFAGLASFGVFLNKNIKYFGQELNQMTWALGTLRIIAHTRNLNPDFQQGDSVKNWNPNDEKFDLILANPPFNLRLHDYFDEQHAAIRTGELFLLKKGIDSLLPKGKLIAVVSNNILYSSSNSEKKLRENLLQNDFIETIISFPSGLLTYTSIPFSIIILNKSKKKHKGYVSFVLADNYIDNFDKRNKRLDYIGLIKLIKSGISSEDFRIINNEKIALNNYDLYVNRYFVPEFEGELLRSFTSIYRGENIHENEKGRLLGISNLKDDKLNFQLNIDEVGIVDIPMSSKKIAKSCLLISRTGNKLKPTYFEFVDENIFINPNVIALEVDTDKIVISYLINELFSPNVVNYLEAIRYGSVIPSIRIHDFLDVKIELPNLNEQKAKVKGVKEAKVSEKKQELNLFRKIHGLESEITQQNSYLRHSLAGPVSNIVGFIEDIKEILLYKVKPLFPELFDLKVSDKHIFTLGEYLEFFEQDVQKINIAVTKRINIDNEIENKNLYPIDIIKFCEKYVKQVQNRNEINFKIDLQIDEEAFTDEKRTFVSPFILSNDELLTNLFDNLKSNAIKHGFQNMKNQRIEISISRDDENEVGNVNIYFSNTGIPLPENLTKQDFIRKGSRYGNQSGDGFGGWYINEIIKKHQAEFEIIDETGPEGLPETDLATTFEFNIPIFKIE